MTGFSVIVSLFQKAPYIERAIESALCQTMHAVEVIVVDDGSTDGGGDLIARSFPEVILIRQENRGEGPARNTGIQAARAEWVAFLDADDLWLPDHLAELDRTIRHAPDAHLVSSGHVEVREGDPTPVSHLRKPPRTIDYFAEASRSTGVVWVSAAAARRSSLLEIGGFSNELGTDLACWARLALRHPVAVSGAQTALYFRGAGGMMEQEFAAGRARPRLQGAELEALRSVPVSPSSVVVRQALAGPTEAPRASLERYLDGRVITAMRAFIASGDIVAARHLRSQLRTMPRRGALITVGLTYLPGRLVVGALAIRSAWRRSRGA